MMISNPLLTLMAINLRGKVCRLARRLQDDSVEYRCLFLVEGTDVSSAIWTEDVDHAAVVDWTEAERLAAEFKGHAVVVNGTVAEVVKKPEAAQSCRRERQVSDYQAELERRKLL